MDLVRPGGATLFGLPILLSISWGEESPKLRAEGKNRLLIRLGVNPRTCGQGVEPRRAGDSGYTVLYPRS